MELESINTHFSNIMNILLDFLFPPRRIAEKLRTMDQEKFLESVIQKNHKNETAIFAYRDSFVRKVIHELKYRANTDAARIFGNILYERIFDDISEELLFYRKEALLLVPIPRSPERLREYGFNQTELICEAIIKCGNTEKTFNYGPRALRRIAGTESQTNKSSKNARIKNVKGVFRANHKIVSGKTILLIDDVTTTGATLRDAHRALREAGARRIISYTIAH